MSRIPSRCSILLTLILGGCAAAPRSDPATGAAPRAGQRRTDELVALGRTAAARGDAVRAEQYFGLAIEQGADRRAVLPILLRACLSSSHLRAALNYAEPYLLDQPGDDALRFLVANIHLGLGQIVAARRELGLLLQRDAANPDAHYLLGIIDTPTNIEHARTHFLRALEHSKDAAQRTEIGSRLAELQLRETETANVAAESGLDRGAAP